MYIPMYKNRDYENRFLRDYSSHYSEGVIIPYIEIIEKKIFRKGDLTEFDLIKYYDEILSTKYFIDFYTFDPLLYPQTDVQKLSSCLILRTDNKNEYLRRLLSTINSDKAIPVISIKYIRENILEDETIKELILKLQEFKDIIAVRVEAKLYSDYSNIFSETLREDDYLFFDISEDQLDPYFMDVLDLKNQNYKKVLTNSPRKRSLNNTSYLESGFTDLIDNRAKNIYLEEGFNAYSDYSGLKDDLPKRGGGGKGAALAMLYSANNNSFYTIVNKNTDDGVRGYKNVLMELNKEDIVNLLDMNDCLAYEYIKERLSYDNSGNYASWNYITLLRMLSEIKKSTNDNHL